MPHGKNSYLITEGDVVQVIAGFLEQNPTRIRYRGLPIQAPDVGCVAEEFECSCKFVGEQAW
jgi:hypothetical protein